MLNNNQKMIVMGIIELDVTRMKRKKDMKEMQRLEKT